MTNIIDLLNDISLALREDESQRLLDAIRASMERESFHVAVLGEFKRGKSSFINALLGRELLQTDILPATAVLHILEYGDEEAYDIVFHDGKMQTHPLDAETLAELAVGGTIPIEKVRWVRVRIRHALLKDGLVLIDTPGVNDINAMRAEVTYTILPSCDAALFLLDAVAPLTRSEADFLQTKVMHHKLNDIVFLVGKSDRLEEDELAEALEGAAQRVVEVVGRPLPILPFSSREVTAAVEAGQDSLLMTGLLDQLAHLRSEAGIGRERRHAERLMLVADELMRAVGWQDAIHQSNALVLDEHRRQIARVMDEAAIRFERLLASIDTVGRDGLAIMLGEAYRRMEDNLLYDLKHDVQTRGGNLDTMLERDIPLQIDRTLRQFSEAKAFEIGLYLQRFQDHLAKEYVTHFQVPLALALEDTGIRLPVWHATVQQDEQHQVGAVIKYAAPATVLAIVGSMFMPGVGTVVGGALGGILSTTMRGKQTNELRNQILNRLPDLVRDIVSSHREEAGRAMDGWFDRMKIALRTFHERQLDRLRMVFEAGSANPDLQQTMARQDHLKMYQDRLAQIRLELQSIMNRDKE